MFLPKEIFYEKDAWNYELGKKLLTEYKLKGIKLKEIENHNNIEELRKKEKREQNQSTEQRKRTINRR